MWVLLLLLWLQDCWCYDDVNDGCQSKTRAAVGSCKAGENTWEKQNNNSLTFRRVGAGKLFKLCESRDYDKMSELFWHNGQEAERGQKRKRTQFLKTALDSGDDAELLWFLT